MLNLYCFVSGNFCTLGVRKIPKTGGCCRSNSNTSLLFLCHPVHGCSTIMHFTDFMVYPGIIQYPFCSGGFACINMSGNSKISLVFLDLPLVFICS